jgi:hypothetical protein
MTGILPAARTGDATVRLRERDDRAAYPREDAGDQYERGRRGHVRDVTAAFSPVASGLRIAPITGI